MSYDYDLWIETDHFKKIIHIWKQNFREELAKTFDKRFSAKNVQYNTENLHVIDCIQLLRRNFQFEANLKICLKEMYKLFNDDYYKDLQTSFCKYFQQCNLGNTTVS